MVRVTYADQGNPVRLILGKTPGDETSKPIYVVFQVLDGIDVGAVEAVYRGSDRVRVSFESLVEQDRVKFENAAGAALRHVLRNLDTPREFFVDPGMLSSLDGSTPDPV